MFVVAKSGKEVSFGLCLGIQEEKEEGRNSIARRQEELAKSMANDEVYEGAIANEQRWKGSHLWIGNARPHLYVGIEGLDR